MDKFIEFLLEIVPWWAHLIIFIGSMVLSQKNLVDRHWLWGEKMNLEKFFTISVLVYVISLIIVMLPIYGIYSIFK